MGEWADLHRLAGNILGLGGGLLQQVAGWNQMVAKAGPHVRGGLLKNAGYLMQAGNVVLIVFYRTESRARGQARNSKVHSIHLVNGHFPVFELRAFDLLAQIADHQILAHALLLRETRGVDGLEDLQRPPRVIEFPGVKLRRVIAEAVIVPIVADRRGKLGVSSQLVFPFRLERGLQARPARFGRIIDRTLLPCHGHHAGNCNQRGKKPIHGARPSLQILSQHSRGNPNEYMHHRWKTD